MTLRKRLQKIEAHFSGSVSVHVPTASDIWRWQLTRKVHSALEYYKIRTAQGLGKPDDSSSIWLYKYQDSLRTDKDIIDASDDVLLEALGLPNVEAWGWLRFMVKEIGWCSLLCSNWNLPHLSFFVDGGKATTAEMLAWVGRSFCELMRERYNYDALGTLQSAAEEYKKEHKMPDADFLKMLRAKSEWLAVVYTCEAVSIRPEAIRAGNDEGRILYSDESQAEYFAEMRGGRISVV